MRPSVRPCVGTLVASLLVAGCGVITASKSVAVSGTHAGGATPALPKRVAAAGARIPIVFTENRGQVDARARFYARTGGQTIWLTDDGLLFDLTRPLPNQTGSQHEARHMEQRERLVFRQHLVGAAGSARLSAIDLRPGTSNFFLGNDRRGWRTGVPSFGEVVYRDVYPGIDLRLYGNGRALEQEFVVHPGADPSRIRVAYEGAGTLRAAADGGVRIQTAFGDIVESAPRIYQQIDGTRVDVAGRVQLAGDDSYVFDVGTYRSDLPLVIDPTLEFATYLGGSNGDWANDVAVDSSGNMYVTGYTLSTNFPLVSPIQATCMVCSFFDIFVTKIDASGSHLVYSTYLGGSNNDRGLGIAVGTGGQVFLTGETASTNFPLASPLQTSNGGGTDAFVVQINATGSALVYATYLGGSGNDSGNDIAVDSSGNAHVVGSANSTNFPRQAALKTTCDGASGAGDAFVTKIAAGGAGMPFSTCIGGTGKDLANAIALNTSGQAFIAGSTASTNFPTAPSGSALQPALAGVNDAFVMKINVGPPSIMYSTYLGGTLGDFARGIALDGSGNAYVTGQTTSTDFPLVLPYRALADDVEAFVSKINPLGTALIYSTYLGGSSADEGAGVAVDPLGFAYVAGSTRSPDFPVSSAVQPSYGGLTDAFVTKFSPAGASLVYSTFLGGAAEDRALGIVVSAIGDAYVAGYTESVNFPLANPIQPTKAGGVDAFVAKIAADWADLAVAKVDTPDPVVATNALTYTITVQNTGPSGATGVVVTDPLPSSATFVSASPGQGSCAYASGTVTCQLGALATGATATVTIVVTPTTATSALVNTASVTANQPDPDPGDNGATASTVVTPPVLVPDISASPASHAFGAVAAGSLSSPVSITVRNDGTGALVIGAVSMAGADAAELWLAGACAGQTLSPGGTCGLTVRFAPSTVGAKSASISITSNDPDENPLQIPLTGTGAQTTAPGYEVRLHSRIFVPPPGMSPDTRSAILSVGAARAHVLIQTVAIPTSAQRAQLTSLGVQLLEYVPNFAWIASLPATPSAVDAIAAHPAVRAVVRLLPDDRLAADVKDGVDPRLLYPDGTAALEIAVYRDVAMASARPAIASAVTQILDESAAIRTFMVRAAPAAVAVLAQSDLLQLIREVAPPAQEDNDQLRIVTKASNVQIVQDTVDGGGAMTGTQPGTTYALDGAGVLVGQWESRHPDCSHPDFAGRLDAQGTINGSNLRVTFGEAGITDCRNPSYTPGGDPTIGDHATHVAGIVLGNGSQSAAAGGLALQWRGMAPNASIVAFQRPVLDGVANGGPVVAHRAQYDIALAAGMSLSTNSWGSTHCHQVAGTCYEGSSAMYDELITDAANPLRDRAISIFGSAGNQGPFAATGAASFSVRIPNSAKNTIVVGNVNSDTLTLRGTSSRGPVDDGRLKPEIVAPGEQNNAAGLARIRSTVMTIFTDDAGLPGNPQGTGCATNGVAADGIDDCGPLFPYDDIGGTSMSTPAAAGAAALLTQYFQARGSRPWPSTIKALLVHTATDQCCADGWGGLGSDPDTPGPDYGVGYGLINVQRAVGLLGNSRNGHVVEASGFGGWGSCASTAGTLCDIDGNGISDDQTYTVNLPPNLPSYRVTLAYDDLASAGGVLARGTAVLRNDLDLFLIGPDGTVYRPWILNSANPTAAATRNVDSLNPLEVVDVANPAGGQWTIVVRPARLIPFDLEPAQRYTLVYESFDSDVMIRDHGGDDGTVPSVRHEPGIGWTPARYWRSPDVTMEGGEAITPGVERAVRVAVTNRGQATVNDVTVHLYWANNGVGLDYADYLAHPMGSCVIASIDPDERSNPADCRITYTWDAAEVIQGEDGRAHVCLLAVAEVDGDPVTYPGLATVPDGANPPSFVPWDNNLAQENVVEEIVGPGQDDGSFDYEVKNPTSSTATVTIEVDTSHLPPGWQVVLTPSDVFTLGPGQHAFGKITLIPPPDAPVGSRAEVSVHGRYVAIGGGTPDPSEIGGFDAVVVVGDITPPSVTVTSPNGGERLFTGSPYALTWTASDDDALSFFDVFHSIDGGVSWAPVPGCTGAAGTARSCTWAAPGPQTTAGRIRVTARDASGNTASDSSDANYSIVSGAASITVTKPNTAVSWVIGTISEIAWKHNLGASAWVRIEISRNGGASWELAAAAVKNSGATSGSFNWMVTSPPTAQARVRVSWLNGPASDASDVNFTLVEPFVSMTLPKASANWGYGTVQEVRWTTNLGATDLVNVRLSVDGGATFPIVLAANATASLKKVNVATPTLASPTAQARIRVERVGHPTIGGTGPENFKVQPPFVTVTKPNGPSTVWTIGTSQTVAWKNNLGALENVRIELSLDGGATYGVVLTSGTRSDGSVRFTVLAPWATTQGRIRIVWLEDATVADASNGDFAIR